MHARIGWQNLRTSEFLDSGNYMLITGTDFNDGAINFSTCHYVERERYEQDRNIQIHNGSILITKDGTLGKVAYVQGLSMPATLNAGVFNVQIKDENNVDEKYLFQYLKAPFLMDYVDKKATGGTIKHLNQSILVDFPVILPQRSEQTLIGAFFQQLDNLITLHQRKCALLFSPFQAFISMMFTTSTFSWEQRKAIDIADYSKGNGYSKGDLSDAGTPIILYGRLYTKYQFAISEVDTFAVPRNGAVYSQGNEVIVPASGETAEDIARASAVEKSGVLLGGDLNILRPFDFINPLFLALAISNGEPQKELAKKAQGKSVVHIHNTDIQEVTIAYPSRTEQDRIVSVFRQLDHLITLHQRKCIFFTGRAGRLISTVNKKRITSSWEQRKFSELVQIERGGSPRPIDYFITDAPNGLNWVKIGDAPTQGNYITKTAEKIRPEGLSKTREVHPGDLILSNSMSFGKPYIMGIDGCIHDGWLLIRNTYGVFDLTFLCHLLGTPQMLSQYRSLAAGSTVNNLNKELVGNTYVTIPSITEQRVLGAYLEQLDNLITLHQRELKKLQNIKKSMLEKMFV